jgi:hypothetical protein
MTTPTTNAALDALALALTNAQEAVANTATNYEDELRAYVSDPEHYGNGGEAIYAADVAVLAALLAERGA